MRLLHTSDWHLGQNFMGQSRAKEHKAFLGWLLKIIKEQKIDVLVVAGDIYDTGTPPNYARQIYYNFLKELALLQSLTTTIITAGNHDSITTLHASKELLELLNIHVITTGGKSEEELIPIYKNKKLEAIICAVPFLRDTIVRDSLSGETISQKELLYNQGIKAHYQNLYHKALKLQDKQAIPIIATGHLTTVGSRSSDSEREIYIGGKLDIGGNYLGEMFDYVALGHLHINQKVGSEHVRYSGSPIPLSFSESTNNKKVNIVSFDGVDISVEPLDIPQTRTLICIKGSGESVQKSLSQIEDKSAWIEVFIQDDNPTYAHTLIREVASKLGLTLLAVKIEKTQKELQAKELDAVSLHELTVTEVFAKRLQQEELQSESLRKELLETFQKVVAEVENA